MHIWEPSTWELLVILYIAAAWLALALSYLHWKWWNELLALQYPTVEVDQSVWRQYWFGHLVVTLCGPMGAVPILGHLLSVLYALRREKRRLRELEIRREAQKVFDVLARD